MGRILSRSDRTSLRSIGSRRLETGLPRRSGAGPDGASPPRRGGRGRREVRHVRPGDPLVEARHRRRRRAPRGGRGRPARRARRARARSARRGRGLAVLAFATASLAWFHRLRVTVDEARLTLGFGPIRRQVALDRIERARPVTYRALTWGGWGIRWRPGTGTLWNVPGDGGRAVELTLRDGRLLLFSSPDPDAAVAAIEAARSAGR